MRRRSSLVTTVLAGAVIAVACAGEEQDSGFDNVGARGGSSGAAGSGGTSGTSASKGGGAGTSASKGGSAGNGDTAGGAGSAAQAGSGPGAAGNDGAGGAPDDGGDGCSVGGESFGVGVLRVDYQANSSDAAGQPGGVAHVVNDTGDAIAESEFAWRYYFTSEFPCSDAGDTIVELYDFRRQNPHEAEIVDKGDVTFDVVTVGDAGSGCDAYIEFSVTMDLGAGQYATFSFGTQPPNNDYSSHVTDQSNDASFGGCSSEPSAWPATPLYLDGVLTWGEEAYEGPDGGGGAGGGTGVGGSGGAPSPGGGQGGG